MQGIRNIRILRGFFALVNRLLCWIFVNILMRSTLRQVVFSMMFALAGK